MIIRTRLFELAKMRYSNLTELAQAMGISVSQVYRVRAGKRNINQKFITGALRAFPQQGIEDLFYLAPETPVTDIQENALNRHHYMVQQFKGHEILSQT